MESTVSLILGGSTGIGKATARLLVREGRTVMIVGRDGEALAAARAELDPAGAGRIETMVADLTDRASVAALVAHVDGERRHVDRLVNAAGTFEPKPFLEHDGADYDRSMELNRGIFLVTGSVARNMARMAEAPS